jgi:transaldolase
MKPDKLKTRIFLDGGDPKETKEIRQLLGFIDGQTTNPTLVAKNPEARHRIEGDGKFTEPELLAFYRTVVAAMGELIPDGSISVEVFADAGTSSVSMLGQAYEMYRWIPNVHIKFPTSREGLRAAQKAVQEGLRVNMTLCFSLEQAAAVYAATRGAKKGQVFVSPFIGRLDDIGENGMDLISTILANYEQGDGHVEVLTASVRTLDHLLYALKLGSDIITAPYAILKAWAEQGMMLPGPDYRYPERSLAPIPYRSISLDLPWYEYDFRHPLTDKGMERFSADWNALIRSEERKAA